MARIRSIKPEFWTSMTVAHLCPVGALTFVGLWSYCDDWGRGVDEARLVKSAVHPLRDDVSAADVEQILTELARLGLIVRYQVDGKRLLAVPSWEEHQKPQHRRMSKFPPPPTGDAATTSESISNAPEVLRNAPENIRKVNEPLQDGAGSREQGVGSREQGAGSSSRAEPNRAALLTAAANKGLTQKFGEQPMPITWSHPGCAETLALFDAANVPDDFARRTLFAMASTCALPRPPRSLKYFARAVVEAWEGELAHRQAATTAIPEGGAVVVGAIGSDAMHVRMAVKYAKEGHVEWQDECARLGVKWQDVA
jgi:hypothetical protein